MSVPCWSKLQVGPTTCDLIKYEARNMEEEACDRARNWVKISFQIGIKQLIVFSLRIPSATGSNATHLNARTRVSTSKTLYRTSKRVTWKAFPACHATTVINYLPQSMLLQDMSKEHIRGPARWLATKAIIWPEISPVKQSLNTHTWQRHCS